MNVQLEIDIERPGYILYQASRVGVTEPIRSVRSLYISF